MNYKDRNQVSVKAKFHVPKVERLLDKLNRARLFFKLGLMLGYHQISIKPKDVYKIAFQT